jgi:hypothetical protein
MVSLAPTGGERNAVEPTAQNTPIYGQAAKAFAALRQFARRLTGRSQAGAAAHLYVGTTIQLANQVTVVPIGVRHTTACYRAHEQTFRSMIASADFAVLELDPSRIKEQCARNPMDQDTGEFYQRLLELAWEHQKPVLHVDPDSAFTTNLSLCSASMASVLAGAGLAALIAAVRRPGSVNPRALSKQATVGALAGTYLLTATTPGVAAVDTLVSKGQLASKPLNRFSRGNPLSHLDFRNAGAILGLVKAAEEILIQGRGYLFVGEGHITEYLAYAENQAAALKAYQNNIYRLLCEHVLRERTQVRLFTPKPNGNQYTFELARSLPLL